LGKKIDTHLGEQNANESSSLHLLIPPPQSGVVFPPPINSIPYRETDDPKESESINNSTALRDTPTPSSYACKPPPPFPNPLNGKKVQPHFDKIRETFPQVKIKFSLLDTIQQMLPMPIFLEI